MHGLTNPKIVDTQVTSFWSCPTNCPTVRAKLRLWLYSWLATVSGWGRLSSPKTCDSLAALLIACWALVRASCNWLSVDGPSVVGRFAAPASRICSNDIPPSGYLYFVLRKASHALMRSNNWTHTERRKWKGYWELRSSGLLCRE